MTQQHSRFPDTKPENLVGKIAGMKKRRAKAKRSKQARKRNRRD